MSEKAIAVGGVALVSLAAFTFSESPESSASSFTRSPEPIVAPQIDRDRWAGDCVLPASPETKGEVTCALPAWPNVPQNASTSVDGVEVFPAPIEIRSAVVAEALDGLRTFRLDRRGAAELVAQHIAPLSAEGLLKEARTVTEAHSAELALLRGVPNRDTVFLAGVNEAIRQALEARSGGRAVSAAELAETIAKGS